MAPASSRQAPVESWSSCKPTLPISHAFNPSSWMLYCRVLQLPDQRRCFHRRAVVVDWPPCFMMTDRQLALPVCCCMIERRGRISIISAPRFCGLRVRQIGSITLYLPYRTPRATVHYHTALQSLEYLPRARATLLPGRDASFLPSTFSHCPRCRNYLVGSLSLTVPSITSLSCLFFPIL
ncbi:hypothetical protein BDZ91DRAFT_500448 [Kalaharituber pfeilii]|nr:hypothetical protein BDZ91DRAFT_500448 [Kalaharituber pfeilii]